MLDYMQSDLKLKVVQTSLPYEIEKKENGKLRVKWRDTRNSSNSGEDDFDTVLVAVGRKANTSMLNLDKVGVKTSKSNAKVVGGYNEERERSSIENI